MKFLHDILGWHTPVACYGTFDGCSMGSVCSQCRLKILQDSQSNWFASSMPLLPDAALCVPASEYLTVTKHTELALMQNIGDSMSGKDTEEPVLLPHAIANKERLLRLRDFSWYAIPADGAAVDEWWYGLLITEPTVQRFFRFAYVIKDSFAKYLWAAGEHLHPPEEGETRVKLSAFRMAIAALRKQDLI